MEYPLSGKFEKGERGFICKRPSDREAWIAPDRKSAVPEVGVEYVLEITGAAKSGRLRFGRVVETYSAWVRRQVAHYEPLLRAALNDPDKLSAVYGNVDQYVYAEVEGEKWCFRVRVHHGQSWLFNWLIEFGMTRAASNVLHEAYKKKQEKEEQERAERFAREKAWQEEMAAKRREQASKDAPLVNAFFAEHPEAKEWFRRPIDEIRLIDDVAVEVARRGLAKRLSGPECVGGTSYRHKFFVTNYVFTVGRKEVFFELMTDDDEYDD